MLRHVPQFAARRDALATPRHAPEKRSRGLADAATLAKLARGKVRTKNGKTGMNTSFARPHSMAQKPLRHSALRLCACCQPTALPANPARRNFLAGGLAALGLGAAAVPAAAQGLPEKTRIDVHHHYVPPVQGEAMAKHGGQAPKWSLQSSLADMEKAGVTTAVLSLAPPGVWFGDVEEGRSLARACNEYGAQLRKDNPGRFGLFAAIPLPDTEGSLREIAYALDVLKADGIGLYTSYGEKYLGDEAFVPVFEELNRRKAMVYTHPVNPACCTHLADGVGPSSIEFATDTTRTIASLIFGKAGTTFRCPDVRFIWSHSGGTLPFLIGRFIREQVVRKDPRMPDGPEPVVRKYFYEIAQGNEPGQFAALLKLVPVSQLLFGSDYPYREAIEAANGLRAYPFTDAERASINRETALRLMPGLAG
jgi:predicted TIM-barrel fold metal-dependent hydrolase